MNSDIRLSVGFWQHPKVRKLEKRLGLKGVRSLQILWCWCAQNRPNGLLVGMDEEDIELAADWHGKSGAFFEQCFGSWIEQVDGCFILHEWQEHNPWQVANGEKQESRREAGRKAAFARWNKDKGDNGQCESDANAYANKCDDNANAYEPQCERNATYTYTNTGRS